MSKKVWDLMYVAGNPAMFSRVIGNASNPMSRSEALAAAEKVAANGWRAWVQHHVRGERIFESPAEKAHQAAAAAKRIIEFAEANVPGYRSPR